MPTYPVPAPTLTGDVLTINRFLNSPAQVNRALRSIADQQFIADKLLAGRVEASGGAILYGVSESIYTDRDPRLVAPGAEYSRAIAPDGQAAMLTIGKYGQDLGLTDEKISREKSRSVQTVLAKSANRTVAYVDAVTLAVINAAVTQTQAAVAPWNNPATADPLLDVMLAQAKIDDLGQGYRADVLVTTYEYGARLTANPKVVAGVKRESDSTITVTGDFTRIGGLMLWTVPAARMPLGVSAFVADSKQLGFMGYENIQSPEYSGSADGIQSWVRRNPVANDEWLIRSRRIFAPAVQEPQAAVKITGVAA
ncbi:hypothetical protein [Kineosporia sp. NBRC 101731]|uniref:phage major capsid protein n=1 Tax=Kineosporia sp. NBRC 101731 TaxID=3032199 RepID=UPI0024A359AC|nr:hypothetical protein [Kineosporia sp. NBRC 101731]GLY32124.1 hypothetical protein Kisp02_54890 [Kineosporia sp. NBRC 101731]